MAVNFQSISFDRALTDTITPTAPSGVVSGDLLIFSLRTSNGGSVPAITGWTLLVQWTNWFGGYRSAVYWRIADGSADDTPAPFVIASVAEWICAILRVDGHDPSTPIDAYSANATEDNSGSSYTVPDITIANNGSLCYMWGMTHLGATSASSDASADGYTNRAFHGSSSYGASHWTGAFNAGTDGGASITIGPRSATFVIAIAPSVGGTLTGSGACTGEVGTCSGTGGLLGGSGACTSEVGTCNATGQLILTGSGACTGEAATCNGTGGILGGAGTCVASAGTCNATGNLSAGLTGSGACTGEVGTCNATGQLILSGNAAPSGAVGTCNATGQLALQATGNCVGEVALCSAMGGMLAGSATCVASAGTCNASGFLAVDLIVTHMATWNRTPHVYSWNRTPHLYPWRRIWT